MLIVLLSAVTEHCATFLHQYLELLAHFLACGLLSLKLLLQSVHVINARTDARAASYRAHQITKRQKDIPP
jgi:hypothetical protein